MTTVNNPHLSLLLVEDNLTDVLLMEEALDELPTVEFNLTHVKRLDEALSCLRDGNFDAVLLDLGLPDSQGLETFAKLQSHHADVPILVLSGLDDETVSVRAVQDGAQDYLLKGKIDGQMLSRTIRYAIERKRAVAAVHESQHFLHSILDALTTHIAVLDQDGMIIAINQAWRRFSEEQDDTPISGGVGINYIEACEEALCIRGNPAPSVAQGIRDVISGQRPDFFLEYPCHTRARQRWFVVRVTRFAGGEPLRVVVAHENITERKQAEQELDASETRFQSIIANTPGTVYQYILQPDGSVEIPFINDGCRELFEMNPDDLRLNPTFPVSIIHPDDYARYHDSVEESASTLLPWRCEWRILLPSGQLKWVQGAARPQRLPDGGTLWDGLLMDITAAKEGEEALRQSRDDLELRVAQRTAELSFSNQQQQKAKEEAEAANLAKSQFLSRMSHELRTPLNAILGFGQILERQDLQPRALEGVGHILKGGRHLLGLINEVLDIASIEAGREDLSLELITVAPVVDEVIALMQPLAIQRNIQLISVVPQEDELHLLADPQRFKQLLINLLSNAVKYNRKNGRVVVSCAPAGTIQAPVLRVCITDTGHGLTESEVSRLFTPFERLGAARTGIEGTGIGLALCKHLVEAMNGAIGVESLVGEGSTFWLEFPRSETADSTASQTDSIESPSVNSQQSVRSVLYIEDDLSNIRVIEMLMEDLPGVQLLSAMQGSIGIELARQHRPNLILLDSQLPDFMGEEVLHRLRDHPLTQGIPVVMLSADATPGQVERLLAAGATGYLTKPLDVGEFYRVLDESLSHERTHAQ